jgi:hypothetical protein
MTTGTDYNFEVVVDISAQNGNVTIKNSGGTVLRNFVSQINVDSLRYFGVIAGRGNDLKMTCIDDLVISKKQGKKLFLFAFEGTTNEIFITKETIGCKFFRTISKGQMETLDLITFKKYFPFHSCR